MSSKIDLKKLEQKAFRDVHQDGLVEVLVGCYFLGVCLRTVSTGLTWLAMFAILFGVPLLEALRRRYTYPRIGYVKLRQEPPRRHLLGMAVYFLLVLGVIAGGIALFGDVRDGSLWRKWSPALAGLAATGGFIYAAGKSGLVRHYAFAALSVLGGIACSLLNVQRSYDAVRGYLLVMGSALLISGLVTFVRFLITRPIRSEEAPDVG